MKCGLVNYIELDWIKDKVNLSEIWNRNVKADEPSLSILSGVLTIKAIFLLSPLHEKYMSSDVHATSEPDDG